MIAFVVGAFFSTIGMGYFIYGKRDANLMFLLWGAALCAYPYFVSGWPMTTVLGIVLCAGPWVQGRMEG